MVSTVTYAQIRQPSMIPNIVGTLIAGFNEDGSTELYSIEPAGSIMKIEDYEFQDGGINIIERANDIAVCINVYDAPWVALFPDDVIALAKHFNLTANDIL